MRNILRNPVLYYLLIPAMVGMWPLLVWAVYLPAAERSREADYDLLLEGQTNIMGILDIDPQRTNTVDPNHVVGEFAYGKAIDSAANQCGILPGKHSLSVGNIIELSGKKRQDARIKLTDVGIVQAARFLSLLQSTWVNLTCETMELTKKKGMPDQWDVDLEFVYYY